MQLQPQLFNLNTLLTGRLFRIPEYQRAYSWETKQRSDLFADIRRIKTSNEDHFIATFVGLAREKKTIIADQYTVVEIVDGQQRLTTLVILLKAVQRSLDEKSKNEKKLSDEILELLVKGDELNLLLLQTNHDTSHIFVNYIRDGILPRGQTLTSADQNVADAIQDCELFVAEWKASGSTLIELIGIIRNRLWAIFHSVEDEALVYRVFEVLNSRGLDVSWIDKLKSQLMGLAFETGSKAGSRDAIKELHVIWQEIYRTIGKRRQLTAETVRFAGTLSATLSPSRPFSEASAVQRLVERAGIKSKDIVDCAKWLQAVVNAEHKLLENHRWRAVTQILQARLVAIAVLLRQFSANEEKALLGLWERVTFRIYGLRRMDARAKVGDYSRLAWDIINSKLKPDEIRLRLIDIGKDYPIKDVIDNFDPRDCYEGWTEQLRYLLYRYDEHLAAQAGEKINEVQWNKIWSDDPAKSIEHVKPQSSQVGYIHHLGNLIMLPPSLNSRLGAKDPKEKSKSYRTSGLRTSILVADQIDKGGWDKNRVEKRAAEILKWARSQWKDL